MSEWRIVVTGSRSWAGWPYGANNPRRQPGWRPSPQQRTEADSLVAILDGYRTQATESAGRILVIHGNCPTGADNLADQWAVKRGAYIADRYTLADTPDTEQFVVCRFPALWDRHGRGAGMARNTEMLRRLDNTEAHHIVVAAWDGQSRGTQHTITEAHRLRLPVVMVGVAAQNTGPVPVTQRSRT